MKFEAKHTFALLLPVGLSSCAAIPGLDSSSQWTLDSPREVIDYYESGLSMPDFFETRRSKTTPLFKQPTQTYAFQFCSVLYDLRDYVNAKECTDEFKKLGDAYLASALTTSGVNSASGTKLVEANHQVLFTDRLQYLQVRYQDFNLEVGDYEQVIDFLEPFFSLEAGMLDISADRRKTHAFNLQAYATEPLVNAYRALGQRLPGKVLAHINSPSLRVGQAFSFLSGDLRNSSLIDAYRASIFADYAKCAQALIGESSKTAENIDDRGNLFVDLLSSNAGSGVKYRTDAEILRLESDCAYRAGKFEQAKVAYLAILKADQVRKLPISLVQTANWRLGLLEKKEGRLDSAAQYMTEGVKYLEQQRASLDTEALRMGYAASKNQIYLDLVEVLVQLGQAEKAFEYAERAKSRTLIDLLATRLTAQDSSSSAGEFDKLQRRQLTLDGLKMLGSEVTSSTNSGEISNLDQRVREAQSMLTVQPISVATVQDKIAQDELFLEFFGGEDQLYVFALTRNSLSVHRLDSKKVESLSKAFVKSVSNPSSKGVAAQGEALFDALIKPSGLNLSTYKKLTVVPHGVLHYVPFSALRNRNQYLVQTIQLNVLPSASALLFDRNKTAEEKKLLIFANPQLEQAGSDLPGAEREARGISKINTNVVLKTRRDATETAFLELAPSADIIHMAMHGRFEAQKPMASGLYMAKDQLNDGVLTTAELYNLKLDARLVVMSACQTAVSEFSRGDDLVGLTRGFFLAGAQTVVATLWEIDDEATTFLMTDFYAALKKFSPTSALRDSQLRLMKRYPHPYYWSAFQSYGRTNN